MPSLSPLLCPPPGGEGDRSNIFADIVFFWRTENSKIIASKVPNAELFIVEGANHSVHAEKPELVLSKIRSHIANE